VVWVIEEEDRDLPSQLCAIPEPTSAEQEAAVFAQAVNIEKLLDMLRALNPAKDDLADNEEIQELEHGAPTQDREVDRQI